MASNPDIGGRPDLDSLEALDDDALVALFRDVEGERRRVEATVAAVVGEIDRRRLWRRDGHASMYGFCRAEGRWSDVECRDRLRVARLIEASDRFRTAVVSGEVGVAQTHELGRAHANPRIGDGIVEIDEVMVDHAVNLSFSGFRQVVRRWERLTDVDGAHRSAEEADTGRDVFVGAVGDEIVVRGHGGLGQGATIKEIFERFCDAEWRTDWDATVAQYGDEASVTKMPRTAAQRRFDAFFRIFERAAAAGPDTHPAEPLVNLVVDIWTLDELVHGAPTMSVPDDPHRRRCETTAGTPIPPADALAAALWGQIRRVVVDSSGVVIDLGRRSRLFVGAAHDAVRLQSPGCVVAGCSITRRLQADHVDEWRRHGPTNSRNGAPACPRHNRWRNNGYKIWRDPTGYWHTYRPDGTEIGAPIPPKPPPTGPDPP